MTFTEDPDYYELSRILDLAYKQASEGKGKERHATHLPFEKQPILTIQQMVGPGFAYGQIIKKAQEASRMSREAALREILGIINYAAAVYLYTESSSLKP